MIEIVIVKHLDFNEISKLSKLIYHDENKHAILDSNKIKNHLNLNRETCWVISS